MCEDFGAPLPPGWGGRGPYTRRLPLTQPAYPEGNEPFPSASEVVPQPAEEVTASPKKPTPEQE